LERSGVIAQAALTRIYRQQIPRLREAIEDLSKGRILEGFDKLDKSGAIKEIPDDAVRLSAIAEKQIEALKTKRSSLIIAPTHCERRTIAGSVRKAMKGNGLLSDSEHSVTRLQRLNLTDSQQRDVVTYEPGQIVEFHGVAKGPIRGGAQEKRRQFPQNESSTHCQHVRTITDICGICFGESWVRIPPARPVFG
jgi:hypothetical protein